MDSNVQRPMRMDPYAEPWPTTVPANNDHAQPSPYEAYAPSQHLLSPQRPAALAGQRAAGRGTPQLPTISTDTFGTFGPYRDPALDLPPSPITPGTDTRRFPPLSSQGWNYPPPPAASAHCTPQATPYVAPQQLFADYGWPSAGASEARPRDGLRTPPPTARAEWAYSPALAGPPEQAGWLDFPLGDAPPPLPQIRSDPPPPAVPQRTRYSVAGVILDEEDFIAYATSTLDWAEPAEPAAQPQVPPDLFALSHGTIGDASATSPGMFSHLFPALGIPRPTSAPPEKRQARPATSDRPLENDDDYSNHYHVTGRRRSSSVDAGMARAAAASGLPAVPGVDPAVSAESSGNPPRRLSLAAEQYAMRGWVHYEPRARLSDPGANDTSFEGPEGLAPPPAVATKIPSTPSRPKRTHQRRASSPGSHHHHGIPPYSPRRAEKLKETDLASPGSRRGSQRRSTGGALSFVNFSSADAPKIMKGVSKSGGPARGKSPTKKVV